jgi:hypothetical protein
VGLVAGIAALAVVTVLLQGDEAGVAVRESFPAVVQESGEHALSLYDVADAGVEGGLSLGSPDVHSPEADWQTLGLGNTGLLDAAEETAPVATGSAQVMQVADIVTKTPDGMMRLANYLSKVEAQMAKEAMDRKAGLAQMKALVEKSNEINKSARKKLEADLQTKMELNGARAKKALKAAMKSASEALAHEASLAKRRFSLGQKAREKLQQTIAKKSQGSGEAGRGRDCGVEQIAGGSRSADQCQNLAAQPAHCSQCSAD